MDEELKEIDKLIQITKSRRILALLKTHKQVVEKEIENFDDKSQKENIPAEVDQVSSNDVVETNIETKHLSKSNKTNQLNFKWTPINSFSFDQDNNYVKIYVSDGMKGVGNLEKDNISCTFEENSFDLRVTNLEGKNYRFYKNNLEHDIIPDKSKYRVKKDKIILNVKKSEGKYGMSESWTGTLTAKKKKSKSDKEDPGKSLQNMMKDLYDNGDEQMRKTIGEAMLKSRQNIPMDTM